MKEEILSIATIEKLNNFEKLKEMISATMNYTEEIKGTEFLKFMEEINLMIKEEV